MKIAPGIHRIGDNSMINAYLVEQAGEVTIIDAGVSGFYKDITGELAAMGRTPADVRIGHGILLAIGSIILAAALWASAGRARAAVIPLAGGSSADVSGMALHPAARPS